MSAAVLLYSFLSNPLPICRKAFLSNPVAIQRKESVCILSSLMFVMQVET